MLVLTAVLKDGILVTVVVLARTFLDLLYNFLLPKLNSKFGSGHGANFPSGSFHGRSGSLQGSILRFLLAPYTMQTFHGVAHLASWMVLQYCCLPLLAAYRFEPA